MRQLCIGIILATLLPAPPLVARELFVDTLQPYTVRAEILDAPGCDGPAFDDVRISEFERGVCLFHRDARTDEDTTRALALLEQAQTRGLPPVHQSFATLLAGLARCDEASRHLDRFRTSGGQSLLERTRFCRARRLSSADLNALRWNQALFEYAEGLGGTRTLDARLTELSACYAGPLDASFDAECGLITNITETELAFFVDEAVDEVIEIYFAGVESPITAMFARKLARSEGLIESAQAGIDGLAAGAAKVNAAYTTLNTVYEEARDEKMGPIFDAYRESILRATAILDEFDRWKGGLFITSESVNLLPKINERAGEVEEELARAENLEFTDKTGQLLVDIRRIINSEVEDRKIIAQLCRVYFCELTNRQAMARTIRACRRPALANNPLCINQDLSPRGGTISVDFEGPQMVAVTDLCRGAGLDAAFTVTNMDRIPARTCLSAMP